MMYKLFMLLLGLAACAPPDDHFSDKHALHLLLKAERDAHFANDTEGFLSHFADTFVQVNHGDVAITPREEAMDRFAAYFSSVTFSKWDDVKEPVIEFSDDGSMAYAAIEKTVVLTYPDSLGNMLYDSANYAWVSIYKKLEGNWKLVCNASTMEPQ